MRSASTLAAGLPSFEIKSSLEDFRTDRKWRDYLDYCDSFFFAVAEDFPARGRCRKTAA